MNDAVLQLDQKDVLTLARLLDGLHRLLTDGQLTRSQCEVLAGGHVASVMEGEAFQERLADEVAAACALLRQSLEDYDPSAVIRPADVRRGAPDVGDARS